MTMKKLLTVVVSLAALLFTFTTAQAGPVVLMGIDAEDGGPGGHGPVTVYRSVANSILSQVTKPGTSADILVIGGTSTQVQPFWSALAGLAPALSVTFVSGSAISTVSFTSYRMIGVASDNVNTFGGLTPADNSLLAGRSADIASHINSGGGLLGFSNCALPSPYAYLGSVGAVTCGALGGSQQADITPTPAGLAIGITNSLDVCCWHDQYNTFPSFLNVLATYPAIGNTVAALGGSVNIPSLSVTPDTATNYVNTSHTVTALTETTTGGTVSPVAGVTVSFVVSGANSASGSCVTDTSGQCTFTYTGVYVGSDIITATATVGGQLFTVLVQKEWIVPPNKPPDCSLAVASDPQLWPPNHKYRAISILGVTDPDSGDVVTITVTGITQDEPLNTRGDGNTCPDAQIVNGQASVRAERTGSPGIPGNGRVYAITFTASDGDTSCTGTVYVCVPHDQGNGSVCIDDGLKYNSLGPCTGGSQLANEISEVGLTIGEVTLTRATVEFSLPQDGQVELAVFDVAGRRLATVESGSLVAGVYQRAWDMSGATKGLYFVRLRAGAVTLTKTVVKIH